MAPCLREAEIKATPSTIWKSCFAPMKWEMWDPDVDGTEDVSGDCVDGTTFVFVMKDGPIKKAKFQLTEVKECETVRFTGRLLGGLMKFDGFFEISAKDDSTSFVKYTFDMTGPLGSFANWAKPAAVVEGVEKGLENIKNISEKAEQT
eukprot:CAMPEP_0174892436 /NCGR_PEP_ID=MMETSP0167-20121228/7394_1 /TAXON_ID=38298 /ORGANISM="Rhodella maculata, Strain CCMP736" /LENGTH=147 /DNA_ID=CAMNT_0016130935 /DNA_START=118 /DNA_END=561 /DNA_ORIENTATION=+